MPNAGRPQCPNISIQFSRTFESSITTEFTVSARVCMVPMKKARSMAVENPTGSAATRQRI